MRDDDLSDEELAILKDMARAARPKAISTELQTKFLQLGHVEQCLGGYTVSSRGHQRILRNTYGPSKAS